MQTYCIHSKPVESLSPIFGPLKDRNIYKRVLIVSANALTNTNCLMH